MKSVLLLAFIFIPSLSWANCPDFSGKWRMKCSLHPQTELVKVNQEGCESIDMNGKSFEFGVEKQEKGEDFNTAYDRLTLFEWQDQLLHKSYRSVARPHNMPDMTAVFFSHSVFKETAPNQWLEQVQYDGYTLDKFGRKAQKFTGDYSCTYKLW